MFVCAQIYKMKRTHMIWYKYIIIYEHGRRAGRLEHVVGLQPAHNPQVRTEDAENQGLLLLGFGVTCVYICQIMYIYLCMCVPTGRWGRVCPSMGTDLCVHIVM